jgi:AraC-like DNA-binding protein
MVSALDERPQDELASLIASRIAGEGCADTLFPGVRFIRFAQPHSMSKTHMFGPTLNVVAQGRKVARFGSLELTYDPTRYCLVTGETQFLGSVVGATPERPFLGVSIDVPSELVAKTLLALGDADSEPLAEPVPAFVDELDRPLRNAVLRLLHAIDEPQERRIVAPLVLEELAFRLLRSRGAAIVRGAVGHDRDAESILLAMRFIRANATRALTVQAVARHVGMSPSHFAHRFRAVARVTPMRYLKHVRMHEARALLLAGSVRVSEAARRVGYESASHFTRDFKSYFGASPAGYLARLRVA